MRGVPRVDLDLVVHHHRMARVAVWLGWIPLALILVPVWLGGDPDDGDRVDMTDLVTVASAVIVVAGLVLGGLSGARTARGAGTGRRLALTLAAMAGVAVVYFAANDLMYRHLVPLDEDLRDGPSWVPLVLLPVGSAALGFAAGLAARRPAGAVPTGRWYAVAAVIAVVGVQTLTDFVSAGAEMATARFVPEGATTATSLELTAGRHAVFARYDDQPPSCTLTDTSGSGIAVVQPSVEFTDGGGVDRTVLFGVFDLPTAGRVDVACPGALIGAPPDIRGPLDRLLFLPIALLWTIGALPAALLALGVRLRRRPPVNRPAHPPAAG